MVSEAEQPKVPTPPVLFVRPGLAFWVEAAWSGIAAATLQAFEAGCYDGTWCLDSLGFQWPILRADLVRTPSRLERLLPWRRVSVRPRLGPPTGHALAVAVEAIREVLHAPDYDHEGELSLEELEAALLAVQSPAALIGLAHRAV
ncbi:hypothetical protein BH24GEM1_BH24GEM1_13180 [soil metagenome]